MLLCGAGGTDGALRQLAALGRVAPVTLGLRQEFPIAAIDGLAAVEFPTQSQPQTRRRRADTITRLNRTGDKVTPRPLEFYDAVGRRLARENRP